MIGSGWRFGAMALALAVSSCGGGGDSITVNTPPPPANRAPTANFAFSCADLTCAFTSTSTDQDAGDAIVSQSWAFGDASAAVTTTNPSHAFTTAGSYVVALTVADRSGATNSVSRQVTVTVPPVPAAPHAAFTASCQSLDCTFTDTSAYDAGSMFQSRTWDFGDATPAVTVSPAAHRYGATALTTYSVKLTITDSAGKTSSSVQTIVAAPPATTLNCVGGNCVLSLTTAARVTATIVSRECAARNNQVVITSPITETVFADGCYDPIGVSVPVNGGAVFAAGTTLQVDVRSGTLPASMLVFAPSIRVGGNFASGWTLTFDDGFGGPGEPDFNDLVILIKAAP